MLDQVLALFGIVPDIDLDLMKEAQDLSGFSAAILTGVHNVIREEAPDCVLVQGDTTTAFMAALAAFYAHVPVAHLEAGLRTGDLAAPWPEEGNRRLISVLANWNFCPTKKARENLLAGNVDPQTCYLTGNTGVDASRLLSARLAADEALRVACLQKLPALDPDKRVILLTGHRRENFGAGFEGIFSALCTILKRPDVQIVYPVHLYPDVRETARAKLPECGDIHLIEPLDAMTFLFLMQKADMIVTDSGGVQEEAPAPGTPVLITRDVTERPEAVESGSARLCGYGARADHQGERAPSGGCGI